jgi:hypothetical protein
MKILFREVTTGLLSDYLKAYYLTLKQISFLNGECKPYLARYLFDSDIGNQVERLNTKEKSGQMYVTRETRAQKFHLIG